LPKLFLLFLFSNLAYGKNVFSPIGYTAIWDIGTPGAITNGSGTWDTLSSQFTYETGTFNSPFAPGTNVSFGNPLSTGAGGTVTVSGTKLINGFIFDTGPTSDYILSGGTLSCVNASGCTFTANQSGTIGSVITGSTPIIKDGTQTLILSAANTYTGLTTINAGTLKLSMSNMDHNRSSGFAIASGATLAFENTTTNETRISNYQPIITGTGTILKISTGTLQMANNGSNKQTQLNMSAGGLIDIQEGLMSSISTLETNLSDINIAAGALATINDWGASNATAYFDKLSGAGNIRINTDVNPRTLIIGNNNGTATFSGIVANGGVTAILSLAKAGTGTQTFSGQSTYSGGTTVNGGTLTLNGGGGFTTSTIKGNLTINSGGTVTARTQQWDMGYSENATEAVKLITINGGTLTFTGGDDLGGTNAAITMTNGSITGSRFDVYRLSGARTITINPGTSTISAGIRHRIPDGLTFDVATGGTLNFSGIITQDPTAGDVIKAGPGLMNMTGVATYTDNTTISGGTFQIGGAGNLGSGSYAGAISIASGATLTYSSSANQTLSGVISGTGTLTKDTSAVSTLTLTATNTYTGPTIVSAGTLEFLNTAPGFPTGTSSGVSVAAGATVSFNRTTNIGPSNGTNYKNLSGPGSVIVNGTNSSSPLLLDGGWTLFIGTVNLTGAIDVQSGILAAQSGGIWTGTTASLNVAAGAQFLLHNADATVDEMTGAGTIGTGWPTAQTLTVGAGNSSGTFNGVIAGNGVGNSNADIGDGVLSLIKTGTGTQTLSGANTYSGGTTILGGTLIAGHTSAFGTGSITCDTSCTPSTCVIDKGGFSISNSIVNPENCTITP
jgi:autotransporter-associated beta strand protein